MLFIYFRFTLQTDIEYRKKWDKLVIKLDVIDKDDKSNCEVMHWVMHYPVSSCIKCNTVNYF